MNKKILALALAIVFIATAFTACKKELETMKINGGEYPVYRDDKGELLTNAEPKAYSFHYDTKKPKANGALNFWADVYKFNPTTYEIVDTMTEQGYSLDGTQFGGIGTFAANRFTDLMEYLIIVHNDEEGLKPDVKYYQTKGYATVKIDASDPENIKMYGGEQLEKGTSVVVSGIATESLLIDIMAFISQSLSPAFFKYSSVMPAPSPMSIPILSKI